MSTGHNSAAPAVPAPTPAATTTASATPAAPAAAAPSSTSNSMSDSVSSLNELQQKAPGVYTAMMQGIAMNICNDWQQQQQELKNMQQQSS